MTFRPNRLQGINNAVGFPVSIKLEVNTNAKSNATNGNHNATNGKSNADEVGKLSIKGDMKNFTRAEKECNVINETSNTNEEHEVVKEFDISRESATRREEHVVSSYNDVLNSKVRSTTNSRIINSRSVGVYVVGGVNEVE